MIHYSYWSAVKQLVQLWTTVMLCSLHRLWPQSTQVYWAFRSFPRPQASQRDLFDFGCPVFRGFWATTGVQPCNLFSNCRANFTFGWRWMLGDWARRCKWASTSWYPSALRKSYRKDLLVASLDVRLVMIAAFTADTSIRLQKIDTGHLRHFLFDEYPENRDIKYLLYCI